jgi:hypothetical protein
MAGGAKKLEFGVRYFSAARSLDGPSFFSAKEFA